VGRVFESTCCGLAATTSSFLDTTEGQGQVITDTVLIGGTEPKAAIHLTASGFSASFTGRTSHELGPSFLDLPPDISMHISNYDYDRHARAHHAGTGSQHHNNNHSSSTRYC